MELEPPDPHEHVKRLQAMVSDLQAKNRELQSEKRRFLLVTTGKKMDRVKELRTRDAEIDRLREEVERAKENERAANETADRDRNDLERIRKRLNLEKSKRETAKESVREMKKHCEEADAWVAQHSEITNDKLDTYRKELDARDEVIGDIEDNLLDITNKYEAQLQRSNELEVEMSTLKHELLDVEGEQAKTVRELADVVTQLHKEKRAHEQTQAGYKSAKNRALQYKQCGDEAVELRNKLAATEATLAARERDVHELSESKRLCERERVDLQLQLGELKAEVDEQATRRRELDDNIAALVSSYQRSENSGWKMYGTMSSLASAYRTVVAELRAEINDIRGHQEPEEERSQEELARADAFTQGILMPSSIWHARRGEAGVLETSVSKP